MAGLGHISANVVQSILDVASTLTQIVTSCSDLSILGHISRLGRGLSCFTSPLPLCLPDNVTGLIPSGFAYNYLSLCLIKPNTTLSGGRGATVDRACERKLVRTATHWPPLQLVCPRPAKRQTSCRNRPPEVDQRNHRELRRGFKP